MSRDEHYNVNSIRELLKAHGFRFSKAMGQNFLVDPNITEKIIKQSGVDTSSGVLEIGPGIGALTMELSKAAGHVTAVELDKRLVPILRGMFADNEKVSIIQGDILNIDIKSLIDETMGGLIYHVCANLPYNITTPALTALIEAKVFKTITIMIQKEVALRICAKPGSKEYGAFTVYTNCHATPEILFDVPPECFVPRPKVTSSVVRMKIKANLLPDKEHEEVFFRVVRAAFNQRRKTLVNAIHSAFSETHSKDKITEIVEDCGFDARVRGEMLSIEDFIRLSSNFM